MLVRVDINVPWTERRSPTIPAAGVLPTVLELADAAPSSAAVAFRAAKGQCPDMSNAKMSPLNLLSGVRAIIEDCQGPRRARLMTMLPGYIGVLRTPLLGRRPTIPLWPRRGRRSATFTSTTPSPPPPRPRSTRHAHLLPAFAGADGGGIASLKRLDNRSGRSRRGRRGQGRARSRCRPSDAGHSDQRGGMAHTSCSAGSHRQVIGRA